MATALKNMRKQTENLFAVAAQLPQTPLGNLNFWVQYSSHLQSLFVKQLWV
jgi:hypothetical protein